MEPFWEIGGAQAADVLEALQEAESARVGRSGRWRYDGRDELELFARKTALEVLHLWRPPQSVRTFLETGEERVRLQARKAAELAQKDALSSWSATERKIVEHRAVGCAAAVSFWAASTVSGHLVAKNALRNAKEAIKHTRARFLAARAMHLMNLLYLGACRRGLERAEAVEIWTEAQRAEVAVFSDAAQIGLFAPEPTFIGNSV